MSFYAFFKKIYDRIFASHTISNNVPEYQHVVTYMSSLNSGRQLKLIDLTTQKSVSWINFNGYNVVIYSVSKQFTVWAFRRSTLESFMNDLHKKYHIQPAQQTENSRYFHAPL